VSGGLGADTLLGAYGAETLDGGSGADTLAGSLGADVLIGGVGDDVVSGGDGGDQALLGGGNDRFTWNPGDDNDVVEGEGGTDLLDFFGASIGELIEVSANGPRVLFTRNIASVVTDLDDVERIGYHALGGADTVVVNDLAGTDARSVEVDLNLFGGGGDIQPDTVIARGTAGADRVTVASPVAAWSSPVSSHRCRSPATRPWATP
jgi:Ca2+-binding RTX toxin-like protein